ncbi:MAG: hypothetical protein KatS3mg050_5028 [Litorilinea sp.]|nr:MAG: hypothetical protein KatS3mg050_5028 [Litorilinea sp.]
METLDLAVIAGMTSSLIFIFSNLPMLAKAFMTRDLKSYSLVQISLANLGNLIHWIYVARLPAGPIWLLHGFNTLVAMIMLTLYLHYEKAFFHQTVWRFIHLGRPARSLH